MDEVLVVVSISFDSPFKDTFFYISELKMSSPMDNGFRFSNKLPTFVCDIFKEQQNPEKQLI